MLPRSEFKVNLPGPSASDRALPCEIDQVYDPRDALLDEGEVRAPLGPISADSLCSDEELQSNPINSTTEEEPSASGAGRSIAQRGRDGAQEETATEVVGGPVSADTEKDARAMLSEMARTISQSVEAALVNLQLHRENEIEAVRQELGVSKLNEMLQAWPETQQQIAELTTKVSQQQVESKSVKDTLSKASAQSEEAHRVQADRVGSILQRLSVQEAEQPKSKEGIEDLSEKLDLVARRLDLVSKALQSLYEVEQPRHTALQQLTEVVGSLSTSLPPFPEELADELL